MSLSKSGFIFVTRFYFQHFLLIFSYNSGSFVEITPGIILGVLTFTRDFNMLIMVILSPCLRIPTSVPFRSLILLILLFLDTVLLFLTSLRDSQVRFFFIFY